VPVVAGSAITSPERFAASLLRILAPIDTPTTLVRLSLSLSLSLVFLNFRLFFTVKLIVQISVYLLGLASSLLNDYLRS
jgi:hypothetical protein